MPIPLLELFLTISKCLLDEDHKRVSNSINATLNTDSKKGKPDPLQAWSGPEGSRKFRFPDFMTTAQDGGKVVSLTQRPPLPPGNAPATHFC
jgi:hypothetical protein